MPSTGYILCDDLMFVSRIVGTARDLGLEMKTARTQPELISAIQSAAPACVIIDLAASELDLPALVAQTQLANPSATIVAYGSHVDVETLRSAREAGCDPVLPRSRFAQELAASLPQWFGRP